MQMMSVSSSNLSAVGYDKESSTLRVAFHSGGIYDYPNTPESLYIGLMNASSKGEFHAAYIKNRRFIKIR